MPTFNDHPSVHHRTSTTHRTVHRRGFHGLALVTLAWLSVAWLSLAHPAFAAEGPSIAPINVNEASVELLAELPGIGPTKAQAIVEDRQVNGPYTSAEDLTRVKGIGANTVARLKDEISTD
ncbi:ComEA family DNA-binding protein [Halomonas sp. DP8Y7-1]|uniref:ComEA family DNA-binding protein n=1 Tax=Halomonas sp. DP8Y7-1 TaxID=2859078 RepID=UPI001C97A57B|nr:ComEA family DNA-binding protein [Halomonas sp. DP8Y7-1]MBY6030836.1 ComEA family DNA-binding protein [Halomonas sp. DP8Y7-1]